MGVPKTYIYSFDHIQVLVCSYSMELFNQLVKYSRSSGTIYSADLDIVSHKIHNRTSCNCREIVKDSVKRIESKLKSFERVIVPVELLELDQANAHLFIGEVCWSKRKSGNKLKIINTTMKNCANEIQMMKLTTNRPRHCLLKLYKILNEEIWLKNDLVGRNNSFNGRNLVYKDCCKEVARELSSKGVLPGDLSQKCVYSRDNNRCWFDYCRLMDICIHFKLSAKEIADFIKHLAAIDPMQPDPVICIKSRFNGNHLSDKDQHCSNISSSDNNSSPGSINSSHSMTSSSSFSDLVVNKPSNSHKSKTSLNRYTRDSGHRTERQSKLKRSTKHTQTFHRNKTRTSGNYPCRCHRSQFQSNYDPSFNDLESEHYLWTPDHHQRQSNEEFNYDNDFYGNYGLDYECGENDEIINGTNTGLLGPCEEEYDFMRQNEGMDNDDLFIRDSLEDLDGPIFCEENDSRLSRSRYPSQTSKQTVFSDRVVPSKNTLFLKHSANDNTLTRVRSLSQPMAPTNYKTYNLISNSNNSQDFDTESVKIPKQTKRKTNSENKIECSTQTCPESPISNDRDSTQMKKFASDSFLCVKSILIGSENNSNQKLEDNVTNITEKKEKTFKGEAVQTDSPPSDLSRCATTSFRSSSQQTKFPDQNPSFIPKFIGKKKEITKDHCNSFPKYSFKNHSKINSNSANVWVEKAKQKHNETSFSYSINKNANNHSLSRSASSRNSQIVEIENDGMEKISSVLVESDIRSILLFREKSHGKRNDNTINASSKSPFFEMDSIQSLSMNYKYGMNINNAIRSVTVSNQGRADQTNPEVDLYRCSVQGCRNLTGGSNHTCRAHSQSLSRDSSCSPDQCISRLSCIVGLNKHILESQDFVTDSLEMSALHKAIYGPYDDADCARVLAITSQRLKKNKSLPIQNEYVNNDSQYLLSLSDPNRRFCNHYDLPPSFNPNQLSQPASQPSYSATKLTKQSLGEIQDLHSRKYTLQGIPDVHNMAPIGYQASLAEMASPLASTAIADCRNAALSNYDYQPKLVSSSSYPMNGAHSLSHQEELMQYGSEFAVVPETLKPEWESNHEHFQNRSSSATVMDPSRHYKLSQTHVTFNEKPKSFQFIGQQTTPCGRRIPVNVQLCPVPGCNNLTTTNSPPCLNEQCFYDNNDKPDSTSRKPFIDSPFVDLEPNGLSQRNIDYSNPFSLKNHYSPSYHSDVSQRNMNIDACEVILDGDMMSAEPYFPSTENMYQPQQKSSVASSVTGNVKTGSADSKIFHLKELNKQSFKNSENLPLDSLYKFSDKSSGKHSIKHVSNHQSWSQAYDTYTPTSYRPSMRSDIDDLQSKILSQKESVRNKSSHAGSNVNHVPQLQNSSVRDNILKAPLPYIKETDIDLKISLKPDKVNRKYIVNEQSFSVQKKIYPKPPSKILPISHVNDYASPAKSSKDKESPQVNKYSTPFNSPTIIKDLTVSDAPKSILDQTTEEEYDSGTLVEYVINTDNSQKESSKLKSSFRQFDKSEPSLRPPTMSTHNQSFSPVTVFTNLQQTNSEADQIILVEPPDSQLKGRAMEIKSNIDRTSPIHSTIPLDNSQINTGDSYINEGLQPTIQNVNLNTPESNVLFKKDTRQSDFRALQTNVIESNIYPIIEGESSLNLEQPNSGFEDLEPNILLKNEIHISDIHQAKSNAVESNVRKSGENLESSTRNYQPSKADSSVKIIEESKIAIPNDPLANRWHRTSTLLSTSPITTEALQIDGKAYGKLISQNHRKQVPDQPKQEIKKPAASRLNPHKSISFKDSQTKQAFSSEYGPMFLKMDNDKGDRDSQRKSHKGSDEAFKANQQWKNVSVFNRKYTYPKVFHENQVSPCPNEIDLYSYVIEIDINKTYPGTATPILTCQLGDWVNNSANIKLVSSTGNHRLIYDQVLFDSLSQNSSGELSDSLVHHGPTSNFIEQNFNISFSTPDLVIYKDSNVIITPEKFQLKSSQALEYCEPKSDSLAIIIDQPLATLYFLTTAFVTIQTCNHTTPLITVNQNISKTKRSKIRKLFKSMKSTKSNRQQFYCIQDEPKPDKSNKFLKTIFLLEFKSKMMSFIKKCKSNRLADSEKSQITSTCLNVMASDNDSSTYLTETLNYEFQEDKFPCTFDIAKCNLWTRSCCDLHLQSRSKSKEICLRKMRKRSLSEPRIENSYKTKIETNQLYRTASLTLSEIPTSGLSLLCFEVLEKMERKLGKNPRLVEQLTAKKFMQTVDFWSQSSKDTMKLIGRALQYLHGNRLEDSRQSNKTLDSVSSIKTCSADCMESISSLRQQIIRPVISTDTVISAYNKYLS